MKKIGLLIPSINEGGAERVVSRLTEILSTKYEINVIIYENTFQKYEINVPIINMDLKSKESSKISKFYTFLKRIKALKKIKNDGNFDLVISFMDSPNMVNILSRSKKCRQFISIRNFNFNERNFILNYIIMKVNKLADHIITVSKKMENEIINKYKIDKKKVTTIYNPYDFNQIKNLKEEKPDIEFQNFIEKQFVFISVGRNTYQKGYWHLIKSFKNVNKIHPNTKLIIVGRDETKGKTEKLIKQLKLENQVLLTGSQKNPFKFLTSSDVYITSSLYEGFPNSLVEAMACGLPVISTDCNSGPSEIIANKLEIDFTNNNYVKEEYGVLIPKYSSLENWDKQCEKEDENLKLAMLYFIENPSTLKEFSEKSIIRSNDFNFKKCYIAFENLIDSHT